MAIIYPQFFKKAVNMVFMKAIVGYKHDDTEPTSTIFVVGKDEETIKKNIERTIVIYKLERIYRLIVVDEAEVRQCDFLLFEPAVKTIVNGSNDIAYIGST